MSGFPKEVDLCELVDELADLGIDAGVRGGYSGRGMYGEEVDGLVVSERDRGLLAIGYALGKLGFDLPRLRTDDLGRKTIVY